MTDFRYGMLPSGGRCSDLFVWPELWGGGARKQRGAWSLGVLCGKAWIQCQSSCPKETIFSKSETPHFVVTAVWDTKSRKCWLIFMRPLGKTWRKACLSHCQGKKKKSSTAVLLWARSPCGLSSGWLGRSDSCSYGRNHILGGST